MKHVGRPRGAVILTLVPLVAALLATGCARELDTDYGSSKDSSINGTSVLAELFRTRGNEVRTAVRLTDQVKEWADVIVRVAPRPGLPDRSEGEWYEDWLMESDDRSLIYIVRDFDAEFEYWNEVIAGLDPSVAAGLRTTAESKRDAAKNWPEYLGEPYKEAADPDDWFRFERANNPPQVCRKLDGPWAKGVTAEKAALTIHRPFDEDSGEVLLEGDGHPLAIQWELGGNSRVLAMANGSFTLNATLANPTRRMLAGRVGDWASPDGETRHVVFVDGDHVLSNSSAPPSFWELLARLPSFRWVAIQMGILGLAVALARAVRLGRPKPEPIRDVGRPSAHAEALGRKLARIGDSELAAQMLERYRAWRHERQDGL